MQPPSTEAPSKAPRKQRTPTQPLAVLEVPGALLRLETVSAISGRSRATLIRDARAGMLKIERITTRCSRVTSENARAYLQMLRGERQEQPA